MIAKRRAAGNRADVGHWSIPGPGMVWSVRSWAAGSLSCIDGTELHAVLHASNRWVQDPFIGLRTQHPGARWRYRCRCIGSMGDALTLTCSPDRRKLGVAAAADRSRCVPVGAADQSHARQVVVEHRSPAASLAARSGVNSLLGWRMRLRGAKAYRTWRRPRPSRQALLDDGHRWLSIQAAEVGPRSFTCACRKCPPASGFRHDPHPDINELYGCRRLRQLRAPVRSGFINRAEPALLLMATRPAVVATWKACRSQVSSAWYNFGPSQGKTPSILERAAPRWPSRRRISSDLAAIQVKLQVVPMAPGRSGWSPNTGAGRRSGGVR